MDNDTEVIKHGVISSVDPTKATARVTFSDRDNVVSYDLPIMHHNTGIAKFYSMPKVGQTALCVFMGTGLEDGFIIGSFYNDENPPPITDENIHVIHFDDVKIEYNTSNKSISIQGASRIDCDCVVYAKDFITEKGISLNNHKHSGVQTGGGNTGGAVP